MRDINQLLVTSVRAAKEAAKVILDVYASGDFQARTKGDESPLTLADRRAHEVIVNVLSDTQLPVLSEEGKDIPFDERKNWDFFWMVDPLDGTKEFINRNGDFTVNIALIHRQQPVLGVVGVPVAGDIYYGAEELGAWVERDGRVIALKKRNPVDLRAPGLRVVASRSHLNPETEDFIQQLDRPTLVSRGSSLKFMLVAEGLADVYPRFGPTMEWDTAAGHGVLTCLDIAVNQLNSEKELAYNKVDLLNPSFLVKA